MTASSSLRVTASELESCRLNITLEGEVDE